MGGVLADEVYTAAEINAYQYLIQQVQENDNTRVSSSGTSAQSSAYDAHLRSTPFSLVPTESVPREWLRTWDKSRSRSLSR